MLRSECLAKGLRSGNVCVVGNINRDIKLSSIVSGDHLFRDGETSVSSIIETIGGGGANSAFAAAALGANVGFLGKAGADPLGERLEQMLLEHGISAHLARDPDHATGTSIALAFEGGHRHFLSCLPNNESLNFDDLHLNAFREYRICFGPISGFRRRCFSEVTSSFSNCSAVPAWPFQSI
jgi:sugar/nucleoside kinase (ribokinase family)